MSDRYELRPPFATAADPVVEGPLGNYPDVRIGTDYSLDAFVVTWVEVNGWRMEFWLGSEPRVVGRRPGHQHVEHGFPPRVTVVQGETSFVGSAEHEMHLAPEVDTRIPH